MDVIFAGLLGVDPLQSPTDYGCVSRDGPAHGPAAAAPNQGPAMKLLPHMLSKRVLALLAASTLCLLTGQAQAQAAWSSLKLSFLQPTGIVGATDAIDVYLRLDNNDFSLPFVVDNSLPFGGLNPADLPADGYGGLDPSGNPIFLPFASYTNFSLSIGFGCSGSFTAPGQCTEGPPYTFTFADNPFSSPYSLSAGQHHDYLFGTFNPSAGPVAAGDYYFYRSVLWLNIEGQSADGTALSSVAFPSSTCDGDSLAACLNQSYFTRTVTAVPESDTSTLLLTGLACFAFLTSRRRR